MAVTGMVHFNINCSDYERSKAFYEEIPSVDEIHVLQQSCACDGLCDHDSDRLRPIGELERFLLEDLVGRDHPLQIRERGLRVLVERAPEGLAVEVDVGAEAVHLLREERHVALSGETSRCPAARRMQVTAQPCIRDIWHDHVLYVGAEVSGFVDFGALRMDHVAADISRLVGSLVGDDPHRRAAALAAYAATSPLTDADHRRRGSNLRLCHLGQWPGRSGQRWRPGLLCGLRTSA